MWGDKDWRAGGQRRGYGTGGNRLWKQSKEEVLGTDVVKEKSTKRGGKH